MATVTIVDPVTRIEGHLKVQVTIDAVLGTQQVVDARCTGTLFRGFENILVGRDPRDAPYLTERICGICPVSHGMASTLALEAAAKMSVPSNARILRNLVLGAGFLQSHILHFYLLASLDYVTGPAGAPWSSAWPVDRARDSRLAQIRDHFATAVTMRRRAHEMGAIFGGKLPAPPAYQAGGFTTKPTKEAIGSFRGCLTPLRRFIESQYVPDAQLLKTVYSEYDHVGKGCGNLLAYGGFDLVDGGGSKLLGRGLVYRSAPAVQPVSIGSIAEMVTHSWYADSTNGLNPASGSTITVDPAKKAKAYSWLKSPRYAGAAFETGPLARMWVNGDYRDGISVMDRHMARALEAQKIADAMDGWLDQLAVGRPVNGPYATPSSGSGVGLTEAPRGALGHWVSIANGRLSSYQVVTPTCWNASPADSRGHKGPLELALIGTPVQNAEQPIEVLRVVHSFDPCMSCAVHVTRPSGKPTVIRSAAARPLP